MGPESVEIIIAGSVMVVVKQVWSVRSEQQLIVVVFCLVQSSTETCAARSYLQVTDWVGGEKFELNCV